MHQLRSHKNATQLWRPWFNREGYFHSYNLVRPSDAFKGLTRPFRVLYYLVKSSKALLGSVAVAIAVAVAFAVAVAVADTFR